ncbi:polysaccharide deacetylase family protein [Streptomyces sp. UNOC14_S4]|uniref:polysaccharide deacetylase family protein n=1 Tax=Streptomyces sp. UNOC14_S4 TaxID=2872340 RepID=UPI001E43D767|nr:polysaccharide deacetylase family protein [Streptomyces sp. UNOC14_S4]MCC3767095.1 polysaccharide deacetylase family protein [Streptomyces sp. UNOC14_S4]
MSPDRVPILMYHAVADSPARATYGLSVSPASFAGQMRLLAERGFSPMTAEQLAGAWRTSSTLPPKPVLITFDDGYEGVHRHALPALAEHGFSATLFASTGWLRGAHETGGALDLMLTWEQVRELADAGMEIGGHSHTHPQLDQLTDQQLWFEVQRCREILAGELGRPPVSFAYPYGYSDRRVRHTVRAAGFSVSLAVGNTLAARPQGPYALERVTVRRSTGLGEFERMIEGRGVGRLFVRDRTLTKGYALYRRTRQVIRKASEARV